MDAIPASRFQISRQLQLGFSHPCGDLLRGSFDFFDMNSYFESMKSIVSERGQVTIPKRIRDDLGLAPGQVIEFEAKNGLLIGRKNMPKDPVAAVTGILKGLDVDEFLEESRGPAWREDLDGRGG